MQFSVHLTIDNHSEVKELKQDGADAQRQSVSTPSCIHAV